MGADSEALEAPTSAIIDKKSMVDYKKEFDNHRLQRTASGEFVVLAKFRMVEEVR